jgi:predicted MPP superfamily phosphohydrolase
MHEKHKYYIGKSKIAPNRYIYVNCGAGFTHFNLRFLAPSEIAIIDV